MASDPTVNKGEHKAGELSPQQKIDGALHLTKSLGTCMFTSSSPDGKLASRAMIPATMEGFVFSFFFNKDSGKSDDM
jgi:general stress protein 26